MDPEIVGGWREGLWEGLVCVSWRREEGFLWDVWGEWGREGGRRKVGPAERVGRSLLYVLMSLLTIFYIYFYKLI